MPPDAAPTAAAAGTAPRKACEGRTSYRDILVSTALIGGSSGLNVLIAVVRTKAFAVLLGPGGIGVISVLNALSDVARSAAALGVNSSGVRQIAAAAAIGDAQRVALISRVLRRGAMVLGLAGALGLVLLAQPLSQLTFGTSGHAALIALVSLVVLLRVIADAQTALLQGLRRIADLARINLLAPLLGTAASIPIIWYWGSDGIAPALVAVAALSTLVSWQFSRQVAVEPLRATRTAALCEARQLLRLGSAFLASALLMSASAYAVRLLVLREGGEAAAGLYHAAWTVSGLYVGFVLQAMAADFYPRLVGAIDRNDECNRLVNEQLHVVLLLAMPGMVATLVLAPLVITLLFTEAFAGAAGLLRWMCLGMGLRIVTWPIGYIVVAKNRPLVFASVEAAWSAVCVTLSWLCLDRFGLDGAGIAFTGAYACHALVLWPIVRRLSGFRLSRQNRLAVLALAAVLVAVFETQRTLAPLHSSLIGIAALAACTAHAVREVLFLLPEQQLPSRLRRLRRKEGVDS